MRLLALRVIGPDGEHPGTGRSLLRLLGLGLAIVPLFAGFLPVLVDARRRGLHDYMASTVVLYELEAQPASTSLPPSSATRRPNRISAG